MATDLTKLISVDAYSDAVKHTEPLSGLMLKYTIEGLLETS